MRRGVYILDSAPILVNDQFECQEFKGRHLIVTVNNTCCLLFWFIVCVPLIFTTVELRKHQHIVAFIIFMFLGSRVCILC